ncbi:MAG TPA: EAL domain-containing protein [Acidimicrobiia bacterium]
MREPSVAGVTSGSVALVPGRFDALDLLADPTIVIDQDLRLVTANLACARLIDADLSDWIGQVPLELVHPDDLPIVLSSFGTIAGKEFGTPIEVRLRTGDGTWHLMEMIGATHPTDSGHIVVVSMRDLTERRQWELAAGSPELFRTVVEHATVLLALIDADGRVRSASGTWNRQLGHDSSHVIGSRVSDWVVSDRNEFEANLELAIARPSTTVFEAVLAHSDGRAIPYQFAMSNQLDDPVVRGLILSATDISARRALEVRLTHMANTDALTGLANRTAIIDALVNRLRVAKSQSNLVVYFIDLDRFKPVNDIYGHDTGDEVLVVLAERLRAVARDHDVIGRLGGDEFVLVCDDVPNTAAAARIAARIEAAVSQPIVVAGTTVQVLASVGYADGTAAPTADGVLAEADASMYRVKQRRRGREMPTTLRVAQRRDLADDLARAIEHGPEAAGLRLHYQPVVALPSGEVRGAEALVRWEHATLGLLGPNDFLPIAEDAGLDLALGRWILRAAITEAAGWEHELEIAVNLSAAQLIEPALVDSVLDMLDRSGLAASRLCVEVTETTMLEGAGRGSLLPAVAALGRFKAAGVRAAIDDFGTGYSSLVHVRELPAEVLKVDRSFVARMHEDSTDHGIVAAVIGLAHAAGMRVIAEGIETEAQHVALVALGADFAQGYRYGRPMAAADFRALFARTGRRTTVASAA